MAVLAADVIYDTRGFDGEAFEVINGDIVYAGGYTALGGPNHGTAATIGRALPWADDTGHLIPAGFNTVQTTGDTSASPIPRAPVILTGQVIKSLAVTAAAGTFDDVGKPVYAIDDGNYTVTRPTTIGWPVGVIVRHRSALVADVYFFSFGELCAMALHGGGRYTWFLGVVTGGAGTGNALTGIKCNSPGKIVAVYGIVIDEIVDADADLDVNLEIGGTNVTGGVIEWLTADAIGTKKAGTAITAENVFHEGDLIDVEVTANTASTAADAGKMGIYADIELFLGT